MNSKSKVISNQAFDMGAFTYYVSIEGGGRGFGLLLTFADEGGTGGFVVADVRKGTFRQVFWKNSFNSMQKWKEEIYLI